MPSGTIRVGFIGAGGIVRTRHVPGLRAVPGVEFAGVVNRSRESSERAAQEFGISRVYDSPKQLIESDEIDAVWIGAHPYVHRELSVAALDAGKHVFCQARMAMDYRDAKLMWERSLKSDCTTMLCPPPHFMYGDRVIRRLIREGAVGEPRNIVVQSFASAYIDADAPLHWRQDRSISGLNTLDFGMMIEVTQRWLGYAKSVTALAHTFNLTRTTAEGEKQVVGRPDTVAAVAELESGAIATITCSGVAAQAGDSNGYEIYGTKGTLKYTMSPGFTNDRITLAPAAGGAAVEVTVSPQEARPWTVEADFIAGVREGRRSVEPSFWDGLKYMEMTEAVFRSVEEGRTISLPFENLTTS
ncbi:MAG: Gfo/Idh/MocA family oxidoreductase [Chloroflexota bacterium]